MVLDDLRKIGGSPKFIRTINGWFVILWLILAVPTFVWWNKSILWVLVLSLWANIISHYTAWIAARTEVRAEDIQIEEESGNV